MFSFYLGHSGAGGLWSDGDYFLLRDDLAKLNIRQRQGVLFTCGCFACQLDGMGGESYGLAAMRNPNGPSAVMVPTETVTRLWDNWRSTECCHVFRRPRRQRTRLRFGLPQRRDWPRATSIR